MSLHSCGMILARRPKPVVDCTISAARCAACRLAALSEAAELGYITHISEYAIAMAGRIVPQAEADSLVGAGEQIAVGIVSCRREVHRQLRRVVTRVERNPEQTSRELAVSQLYAPNDRLLGRLLAISRTVVVSRAHGDGELLLERVQLRHQVEDATQAEVERRQQRGQIAPDREQKSETVTTEEDTHLCLHCCSSAWISGRAASHSATKNCSASTQSEQSSAKTEQVHLIGVVRRHQREARRRKHGALLVPLGAQREPLAHHSREAAARLRSARARTGARAGLARLDREHRAGALHPAVLLCRHMNGSDRNRLDTTHLRLELLAPRLLE